MSINGGGGDRGSQGVATLCPGEPDGPDQAEDPDPQFYRVNFQGPRFSA